MRTFWHLALWYYGFHPSSPLSFLQLSRHRVTFAACSDTQPSIHPSHYLSSILTTYDKSNYINPTARAACSISDIVIAGLLLFLGTFESLWILFIFYFILGPPPAELWISNNQSTYNKVYFLWNQSMGWGQGRTQINQTFVCSFTYTWKCV